METKILSKRTFQWAHFAVIAFHVIVGVLIFYAAGRETVLGADSKKVIQWAAGLLVIISLWGIAPIGKNARYVIE